MSDGSNLKSTPAVPPEFGPPAAADDALPPVEAPTMAFVTQLFLIPLLIVSILVAVWLGVTWVANVGSNPQRYVKDLENPGKGSWQSAAALADMLRNPRSDALKRDPVLCRQLAEVLEKQIAAAGMSEDAINLRMFVCRALGEFYVTGGLPALIEAAKTERDPKEILVRRSAIQALAVLADNTDPDLLLAEPGLLPALRKAARERGSGGDDEKARGELRSAAAYTLGVLGGKAALDELEILATDGFPDARYNAANGLARNGDVRAAPVLIEMLDPGNENVIAGEEQPTAIAWKRASVMINALTSIKRLAEQNPDADLGEIETAVAALAEADLDPQIATRVHTEARDVELRLKQRRAAE